MRNNHQETVDAYTEKKIKLPLRLDTFTEVELFVLKIVCVSLILMNNMQKRERLL